MVENERLKIKKGFTRNGTLSYAIVFKKARVAIYLGTEEKITLIKLLRDVLKKSEDPNKIAYGTYVSFGNGEILIFFTIEDIKFILKNIPLEPHEENLILKEENGS